MENKAILKNKTKKRKNMKYLIGPKQQRLRPGLKPKST